MPRRLAARPTRAPGFAASSPARPCALRTTQRGGRRRRPPLGPAFLAAPSTRSVRAAPRTRSGSRDLDRCGGPSARRPGRWRAAPAPGCSRRLRFAARRCRSNPPRGTRGGSLLPGTHRGSSPTRRRGCQRRRSSRGNFGSQACAPSRRSRRLPRRATIAGRVWARHTRPPTSTPPQPRAWPPSSRARGYRAERQGEWNGHRAVLLSSCRGKTWMLFAGICSAGFS
jgi:hypothetical protein